MLDKIISLLTDVKLWLSLTVAPILANFYGPSYEFAVAILITAVADIYFGYLKNKKTKGEKFRINKTREKAGEILITLIIVTLANVNDGMLMHWGLNRYSLGVTFTIAYGIFQLMRTITNAVTWMPEDLKQIMIQKMKDSLSLKKENKDENKE